MKHNINNCFIDPVIRKDLFKSSMNKINLIIDKIKVSKEGLAEELYDFSRNKSLFYGIFAALGALIAGFLASEAFRRI